MTLREKLLPCPMESLNQLPPLIIYSVLIVIQMNPQSGSIPGVSPVPCPLVTCTLLWNIGFTKEKAQTGLTHRLHRTKQGGQQNTSNAHLLKDNGVFSHTASDTDAHIHNAQTDFPVKAEKAF